MFDSITETSPGVFKSADRPITVDGTFIQWLKKQAAGTPKQRARLCAHQGSDAQVHEMIIALQGSGYVRPHRHFHKSESMHVIEGRAAIIYFTEEGDPLAVRRLSRNDGDAFYCRTDGAVFHTVQVIGESFVFHETIQGPFEAGATEFAPWAPEENSSAVGDYLQSLKRLLENESKASGYLKARID